MLQTLILDESMIVPESFVYDSTNPNWVNNDEHNRFFLQTHERIFNDVLAMKGYVFLNDILNSLGIKPVRSGQILGWGYAPGEQILFDIKEERGVFVITFNIQSDILSILQEM